MSDITTFGETMLRFSPKQGERLETAETLAFRTAGAESNVATAASRLGADTTWISKVPETSLGRRVASDLRRHGVTPAISWSDEGRQGTYYIEQGGDPRGTDVIYDREGTAIATAELSDVPIDEIESSAVFFTTGITPALSETLYQTTEELLRLDTTIAFDLNYRSKLWSPSEAKAAYESLLPMVDHLFVPERDARSILDVTGEPEAIGNGLRTRFDCETVVLTQGSDGALASTATGVYRQPPFETETIDPIGTGDAFVGGFLAQYVRSGSVTRSLEWGAATAALKRTITGDLAVVTESEVESVIDDGGVSINR